MNLNEYKWSGNPRGMHNALSTVQMDMDKLIAMKMGWAKLVVITELHLSTLERMYANNITPIVRVWKERFGNVAATPDMMDLYRTYFDAGVRWFEFYNEPNLSNEWPDGWNPDYNDTAGVIAPLMVNWMDWAETIISWGGYPAFPALAETNDPRETSVRWMDAMLDYLRKNHLDRFRGIAARGLWVATHAYILNHFYQEVPGQPGTPRHPDLYNGLEGGWHFEYPYDPISQADDPGRTVFGGTPLTPYGDPNGLLAMGVQFFQRFTEWFGGGTIPLISTEGGIYPLPVDAIQQPDSRFPAYNRFHHAEATVAMFKYIAEQAPPWYFGMCLWKEDEYLSHPSGMLPAVQRLIETPVFYKTVPPLPALADQAPVASTPTGPGRIHGTPDFHFLLLAASFDSTWFFEVGQAYWQRFRPTLLPSQDYIANILYPKSVGLTVLAAPDAAESLAAMIRQGWPTVWVDLIAPRDRDELARVLNDRASAGRRFG